MSDGIATAGAARFPVWLLFQVNAISLWRRFKAIQEQSRLLTAVILVFIGGYLGVAFWVFYVGLRFAGRFPGLGLMLTERLLFLLFAFLFVLLLLSNLVISYTNLFRNRETAFLLTLPIPARQVFQWKFVESTLLASWAFLFLIAPLLAAYGLTRDVPWHFYPATLLMVALFIVLPGLAGAGLAVVIARYLDRRLFQVVALLTVAALIAGAAWWFRAGPVAPGPEEMRVQGVLDQMLGRTNFAHHPLLPSCWLSWSVVLWSEGAIRAAGYYALVLLSYVLFFASLALTQMGGFFSRAVSTVQSRGSVFGRWQWSRARSDRLASPENRPAWPSGSSPGSDPSPPMSAR